MSATYRDGYRAAGMLTIFGRDAAKKARRCGEIVLERLRSAGLSWRDSLIECLGTGACAEGVLPDRGSDDLKEVVLRIALEADDRKVVEYFTRQIIPLVTAGPQGTTGYAEGRPRVHPIVRYWPCLIDRRHLTAEIDYVELPSDLEVVPIEIVPDDDADDAPHQPPEPRVWPAERIILNTPPKVLGDLAIARSGDKGTMANIGVVSRNAGGYPQLCEWLTSERVATFLAPLGISLVERFELPNLNGFNFLVHGVLSRGFRNDVQGKTLGQLLLEMPLHQT